MTRVLVTGGAGFIGTHLVAELVDRGYEVRILDCLRADVHREPLDAVRAKLPAAAELIVGDVRDRAAVNGALDGMNGVFHLAAKVGLGVDEQDLPDYADSNVTGTAVVLAAMASAGIARMAIASSMVIYGEGLGLCAIHGLVSPGPRLADSMRQGQFEAPCPLCGTALAPGLVGEDSPPDPRNGYAVSKLSQEQLAAVWARSTGGALAVLRYHNVYGPGLPADTPYAGVAAIFLSALRNGKAPQVYEDGGQRRDFVHVRDVASATVDAYEQAQVGVRAFNVGSGTARTVGDLARGLAEAVGGPRPEVTGGFRLGDVRHITADSQRIRTELGWLPKVEFADGLRELAAT
jgi:dTDP-L-rhamnose 4-epimerase